MTSQEGDEDYDVTTTMGCNCSNYVSLRLHSLHSGCHESSGGSCAPGGGCKARAGNAEACTKATKSLSP